MPRSSRSSTRCDRQTRRTCVTSTSSTKSTQTDTPIIIDPQPVPGEIVLVRWPDDGWYYHSQIVTERDADTYAVVDSTGHVATLPRTDILVHSEREFNVIQPSDHVIALHPRYTFSYAPAIVKAVFNAGAQLKFYDMVPARLPYEEVYKITADKYRDNVDYILECEQGLSETEATVIARDDRSGEYKKCTPQQPVGTGQQIRIRWSDRTETEQCANHIFGAHTQARNRDLKDWQYALAPTDRTRSLYLPAEVENRDAFSLIFCNGQRTDAVSVDQCFWINLEYFKHASEFHNFRHQP